MRKRGKTGDAGKPGSAGRRLLEHVQRIRAHQVRELFDYARRLGPAGRARRRATERLARSAGLDLADMDAAHDRDWKLALQQVARQQKAALGLLHRQEARQRQALRTIVDHRDRFEYRGGNPHTSICLWRSVGRPGITINPQTFNDGVVQVLALPAPPPLQVGRSLIGFTVEVRARAPHDVHLQPAAAVDIFTEHVFEGTVTQAGSLTVTVQYAPIGFIFLGAPGDCVLPGEAGADVLGFMSVEIDTVDGDHIDLPMGPTVSILNRSVDATCDGKSALIPVGGVQVQTTDQLIHPNVIQVLAGDRIRVTAGVDLFLKTALRGTARATFTPQPSGVNVPLVVLRIDS
jgi:hypothetical protein